VSGKSFVVILKEPVSYKYGLALQEKAFSRVSSGEARGTLLLLQHKPVFTIGRSGGRENLLADEKTLRASGIEICETDRGGNITYHGPGHIVAYPIFDLSRWKKDLSWYVTSLEEVVIQVLEDYGITAGRKAKYRGVWVGDKKIAAIGISVHKWITMHGFAFNVKVNKDHFNLINPCGIKEFYVASLDDFLPEVDYWEVLKSVREKFSTVFGTDFTELPEKML